MTEIRRTDYLPAMGKHWLLPLYDPFTRLWGVRRVHEQLLGHADIRGGLRVLEIGCGTGNLLTALGRRTPDVDALGIDPDPRALRIARRKAASRNLPVRYEQAFAGDLPLPDDTFDRVLSSFMLHHLDEEERMRALREVRRVLRPGGQLHVVDADASAPGGHRKHPHLAHSTPDRVLADLRAAGLTGAAETGRGTGRFGAVAFYRAEK
ncbi:class I SAM-dependent methyltransferase [Actinoplanes sp. NPDC051633]|uniref:class I SAM-dependent methyltransferase n=1 Tax=Actinoplanes sp. NPDC051633 TaxID=3155670 RepID=UPI00344434E9